MSKTKTTPLPGFGPNDYRSVYSSEPLSVRQMLAPNYARMPVTEHVANQTKKSFLPLPGGIGKLLGPTSGGTPVYETRDVFNPTEPSGDIQQFVDYAYRLLNPNLHRK